MVAALKRPGLGRGGLGFLIGSAFGFGLVVALRAISDLPIFQTEDTGYPHVIVPAITGPLGFLIGLGAFDYWFRWAAGRPTYPAELEHVGAACDAQDHRDVLLDDQHGQALGVEVPQ